MLVMFIIAMISGVLWFTAYGLSQTYGWVAVAITPLKWLTVALMIAFALFAIGAFIKSFRK